MRKTIPMKVIVIMTGINGLYFAVLLWVVSRQDLGFNSMKSGWLKGILYFGIYGFIIYPIMKRIIITIIYRKLEKEKFHTNSLIYRAIVISALVFFSIIFWLPGTSEFWIRIIGGLTTCFIILFTTIISDYNFLSGKLLVFDNYVLTLDEISNIESHNKVQLKIYISNKVRFITCYDARLKDKLLSICRNNIS